MKMTKERRYAVVGGGIGGLAFALLAARRGCAVDLFEASPVLRAQGSGFVVQPGGQAVLRGVGLWDGVAARSEPLDRIVGKDMRDGRTAIDLRASGARLRGHAVERGGLVTEMASAAEAAGVRVHTGARVASMGTSGVHLDSGESFGPFDGVVDASGAGGVASDMRAPFLPYGAFWATVPWVDGMVGVPRRQLTQRYHGTRRMAGVLPLGRTRAGQEVAAFFWSVRLEDVEAIQAEGMEAWRAVCVGFWPEVEALLAPLHTWTDVRVARYSHGRLPDPTGPGMVRIGDAAHRTSPQLGQGANMALLDAWALDQALAASGSFDEAAARMARARRVHTAVYHAASALFTPQYQSDREGLAWLRNRVLAPLGRVLFAPALLERLSAGVLVPAIRGLPLPPAADGTS